MGRGQVGESRGAVQCEGLESMRVFESNASLPGRDEHTAMIWKIVLSREDVISPHTVMKIEEEGEGGVEGTLGERGQEWSRLP